MLSWLLLGALVCAAPSPSPSTSPVAQVTLGKDTYKYISLVGRGEFPSDARDKFGDTAGGWGSGIAADLKTWKKNRDGSYSGILYAAPDRGWITEGMISVALQFDKGTVDYPARIHTYNMSFTPYYGTAPVSGDQLVWTYIDTLLLYDNNGVLTTGLDADFNIPKTKKFPVLPAGQAQDGTLKLAIDSEGLVVNPDGSFYISDEYGRISPNALGTLVDVIVPPDAFIPIRNGVPSFSSNTPPIFAPNQIPTPLNPTTGRQNNQGFDGMTISPDGTLLYVMLQSSTVQDSGTISKRRNTRLLEYNLRREKWTGEWVVQLPTYTEAGTLKVTIQSELHYLDKNRFLVLARDTGHGFGQPSSTSLYRQIDIIDISKATNIIGTKYDSPKNPISPNGNLVSSITPAQYTPFIDFNNPSQLSKFGLVNGGPLNGPGLLNEKWESIALLPTFRKEGEYFLLSVNDNDFVTQNGFRDFGENTYKDDSGLDYTLQALVFLVQF